MELRQLEYFVAVAEEANFTRAAERVNITQSGISAQIRGLERELGAELFDRSTRRARLTPAGEAALGPARAALAAAQGVREAVGEVTGLLRGRVNVGMVVGCTVTPLFDALAAFHGGHPGIEVSLHEDTSERLIASVREGTTDLALVGVAGAVPNGLEAHVVVSEPLAVLAPPGHPLADAESVSPEQVAAFPIVCMPRGTGIRTVLEEACAAHGVRPYVAVQATAADAVADLAARGLGVAVLSASMAPRYADRLRAARLEGATSQGLLAVVWQRSPGPALRELVRCARRAFAGEDSRAPAAG